MVVHLIRVREVQIEEHSDPRDARAAWRATHHEDLRAHLEAPGALAGAAPASDARAPLVAMLEMQ